MVDEFKAQELAGKQSSKRTIIAHLYHNEKATPEDQSDDRLLTESLITIVGGTVTTAWTIAVGIYYIVANPAIRVRVLTELATIPDLQTVEPGQLDQLPYFSAVVKEVLRLSYGGANRLPRINPRGPINLPTHDGRTWSIPSGYPVGMSNLITARDASVFPDPLVFKPERWLVPDPPDRYLLPFSRGTRSCIGMHLAQAEVKLALARLATVDLELFETTIDDVDARRVWEVAIPQRGTKGVRMKVKGAQ